MLHYFEHVLIVIHWVADGKSNELCGEHICSPGIKFSLLNVLSRTPESLGLSLRVRPLFLL